MLGLIVKTLFVCVFISFHVKAYTEEDIKKLIMDSMVECAEEFPLTPADIEAIKEKSIPDNGNVKCMFACTYKKTGMMNEKGELSVEGLNNLAKKYFADKPEIMKKATDYAGACKSVNDEIVSDGEKGCERAALIYKCSSEKAAEFDLLE